MHILSMRRQLINQSIKRHNVAVHEVCLIATFLFSLVIDLQRIDGRRAFPVADLTVELTA